MIDTIKLKTPILSEYNLNIVSQKGQMRQGINLDSGEVQYTVINNSLKGSYDTNLSVKLSNYDNTLYVEGSPHKLILGHNCYGGSDDFIGYCKFIKMQVELFYSIELPSVLDWEVYKIDYTRAFDILNKENMVNYFLSTNKLNFPRRQTRRYGVMDSMLLVLLLLLSFMIKVLSSK